jgi:hypothetical protein
VLKVRKLAGFIRFVLEQTDPRQRARHVSSDVSAPRAGRACNTSRPRLVGACMECDDVTEVALINVSYLHLMCVDH